MASPASPAYDSEKSAKAADGVTVASEKHDSELELDYDENGIVEGSEGVTHKEFETLRKVSDKINWSSWLVIVVEFAERCASLLRTPVLNS